MVSEPVLHTIGTVVLILVLVGITLYSYTNVTIMRNENLRNIYKTLADAYASSIRTLYEGRVNNTIITINNPVEVSSKEYYNVYVGYGRYLIKLFPNIGNDPKYSDYNIYVVVASPDSTIYAYSLAIPSSSPDEAPALIARGELGRVPEYNGFPPSEGYVEQGLQWFCRMPVRIVENSGKNLTNYPTLIVLNISSMGCVYGDQAYYPTRNDIRFVDASTGMRLGYWIEYWSNVNGVARVWVMIPSLEAYGSRDIFVYWGQPLARDLSDTSIFDFYDNMSNYRNMDELLRIGYWHLYTDGVSSYSGENYVLTYGGNQYPGFKLTTTLARNYKNAYLNIFSTKYYELSDTGWILEAQASPLSSSAHDLRLAWYNSSGEDVPLFYKLMTGVYDEYIGEPVLDNYTVIWGTWNITTLNDPETNETYWVLNGTNNQQVANKWAAAILRRNAEYTSTPGKEYFTYIAKIYVERDSIYRGVIVSETTSLGSTRSVGIGVVADNSGLKLVKTVFPTLSSTILSSTTITYTGWIYLKVLVKGVGQANPYWDIKVMDEDGNTLLQYSVSGTISGGLDPIYVGFYSYSDNSVVKPSYYRILLSSRYDYTYVYSLINTDTIDLEKIYVIGLPENWTISIYDTTYNTFFNATSQTTSSGSTLAVIDVSKYLILGYNGTLYITIYDQFGNPVYYVSKNMIIPGGSILTLYLGVYSPVNSIFVSIDAVTSTWRLCRNTDGSTYVENTLASATTATPYYLGLGLYNNKAYYYIYRYDYGLVTSGSIGFSTTADYRIVIGSAKVNDNPERTTIGFYGWIRVRPFVYPEPSASPMYGNIESLITYTSPIISYTIVSNYIVFGSMLMVDVAHIFSGDKQVIVILFRGVRVG